MAICIECGAEFDVTTVRRKFSREYMRGVYDQYYPDTDVCYNCALPVISADFEIGEEIADDMGSGWDSD